MRYRLRGPERRAPHTGTHKIRLNGEVINHTSGVSCYSEYMVLAEGSVIPIEKDIPLEDAALFGCAVITGVGAVVNTAAIPPGATVAVLGLGGVGLNAMMAATLSGAERVIAVDVLDDKLAFARQLGATDTVNASDPDAVEQVKELTKGGVDYAVELAGVPAALEAGYAMCRRGGTVVTAGLPRAEATLDVPIAQLVSDNRTIKGSYMGSCVPRRDIPRFLCSIAREITGRPAAQRLCRFRRPERRLRPPGRGRRRSPSTATHGTTSV